MNAVNRSRDNLPRTPVGRPSRGAARPFMMRLSWPTAVVTAVRIPLP